MNLSNQPGVLCQDGRYIEQMQLVESTPVLEVCCHPLYHIYQLRDYTFLKTVFLNPRVK